MAISLDIFADPICPWCAIGKARLDRAEAAAGAAVFERRWRVFQLNPNMPAEGVDRRAYLEAKFGGPERARQIYGAIEETAEREGLGLHFDKISRTPSTLEAHRLLKWVAPLGGQDRVMDALMDFYFREGRDISERAVLLDCAERGGLERAVAEALFEGDAEIDAVRAEHEAAEAMGVSGAPTFVIGGARAASGALETTLWTQIINEIAQLETL